MKSLEESKSYLNNDEITSLKKDQEKKIKPAAYLNAKIQPLMRAGDPEQVSLLAEALERLEAVVGGSRVQAEAVEDPEGDHGGEVLTGRFLR